MSTNETPSFRPPGHGTYRNYLVVAADMAMYTGQSIDGCNLVLTSAQDELDALETALSALEEGYLPVVAFDAAELRRLADHLTAHPLKPKESYNASANMTEAEIAEISEDEE